MNTPLVLIRFTNIILAAILAGVSFGIWIGFNPWHLSPAIYLDQQQHMLQALKVLMISLVVITTVATIISAYLQRRNRPVFITLLTASLFFLACILITRFGNKPIDDAVMTWNAAAIPENWMALRNQWWNFHIMRTLVELAGLGLVTWAGIKRD